MITTVICLNQQELIECVENYFQQNPEFHVVERTDKGNVAIQAIMGVSPDLVICEDVFLASALEILEAASRYAPNTYFLVCNGKRDPDAFLALLRAGMNDLLPVGWTEDEVWSVLDRFRFQYQAVKSVGQMELERSLRKVLDKKFFEDTIVTDAGAAVLEDLPMLETEYQISFVEGTYQALFILIDPRPKEQLLAETFLPMLQVEQEARLFFGQRFETVICYLQEDSLSMILNTAGPLPDMRLLCRKFLSDCSQRFFWLTGGNTLSVGIGLSTRDAAQLPLEIQAAKFAAWMRLSQGKGRVLSYGSFETRYRSKEDFLDDRTRGELEAAVKTGDCKLCMETATACLRAAENAGVCISRALSINDTLILAFNQYGQTAVVENGKYLKHAKNLPPKAEHMESLQELIAAMSAWIEHCFLLLEDRGRVPGDRAVQEAKRYIQAHYAQPIRLEDAAAAVNLSASYFCAKFKKETGQTFVGYLTALRLERAKVLLNSTDLKIGEIAEQVGFQDARHFSRIFRQQTGALPTEFRRR